MFQNIASPLRSLFFISFLFFGFLLNANSVFAYTYEVAGFGWSADNNMGQGFCDTDPLTPLPDCSLGGIGWISFSNKSDKTTIPYGVFIDGITGFMYGYAWSSNIGWITFNPSELSPKPGVHIDMVSDPVTGVISGGSGEVTGWARACIVFVSGCSGTLRSALEVGGWDGWISMSGTGYGLHFDRLSMKFLGPMSTGPLASNPVCDTCYAWGGGNTGFGWGINLGGLSVLAIPPPPPQTLTFLVNGKTSILIPQGQSATLQWITGGDISSCNATGDWSNTPAKGFEPDRWYSEAITPIVLKTYVYNLQCTGAGGNTPLRSVSVIVTTSGLENGMCGSANGKPSKTPPVAGLCDKGGSSAVTQSGDVWHWTCSGANGGADASCSAPKKKSFHFIQF